MVMAEEVLKEEKKEKPVSDEPKTVIAIQLFLDGHMELKSGMQPPMVTYILQQMIFNILAGNIEHNAPRILRPAGGLMGFIRNKKRFS